MALSPSQIPTLKADIDANSVEFGGVPNTPDGHQLIADAYNLVAVPDFWVFKTQLTLDQVRKAIVWSEVFTVAAKLPAEERWGFDTLVGESFDPQDANNRTGLSEIFKGGTYAVTRANMLAAATEKATRAEKLFAVAATGPGGGSGSAQNQSAVRTFVGELALADVERARQLV